MAIQQVDGTSYITRTWGDFPANTGDWTMLVRFKYLNTPAGLAYLIDMFKSADNDAIYLGSNNNTSDVFLEATNHSGSFGDTPTQVITVNVWNWVAATYTQSSHVLELTVNGVSVGTVVVNLDGTTYNTFNAINNGSGSPNVSICYYRAWNNILSTSELTSEAASMIAVKQTGLLWDCPLQTSIDLTSHNNTLNQFSAIGTITTNTTDPLLSVVAGPPANISPATATTATVNSAVFQDTLTAGAATTVWYKVTAGTGVKVMGAASYGDAVTYKPATDVFEGLANANANVPLLNIGGVFNKPLQFPVTPGLDYYFKCTRNGAVTPATLQFSALNALDLPVPIGSIAINDDFPNFPLVYLDINTGYPINFINPFPCFGEGGAPLSNGRTVVCMNVTNHKPQLFDPNMNSILELNLLGYDALSSNLTTTFLIGEASARVFRLCDVDGNLTATTYGPVTTVLTCVGLNNDVTKVYYRDQGTIAASIHSWDLASNTAGSDLVAGIANFFTNKDIIVLQDGTILVQRSKISVTTNCTVKRYNTAGVEQNSYDFGDNGNLDNRLATAIDDPVHFFVWLKGTNNTSAFKKVKVSDGTTPVNLTGIIRYEAGVFASAATPTPVRFGHPESCPFWITRVGSESLVNPGSGLYKLTGTNIDNVRITHDRLWIDASVGTTQNVAIPNPFAESYLAGDE